MVCFLTSSLTKAGKNVLSPENGFVDKLHYFWNQPSRCLLIASDPQNHSGNDVTTDFFRTAFEQSGFEIQCHHTLRQGRLFFTQLAGRLTDIVSDTHPLYCF